MAQNDRATNREDDDTADQLFPRAKELERLIAEVPEFTLAGALAKVRVATKPHEFEHDATGGNWAGDSDVKALVSAIETLERLAAA